MTIKITDNHAARLDRLDPHEVRPVIAAALEDGADNVVEVARFHINDGAISGPGHIAGPEGGYPNSDTHELEQSLHRGQTIEIGADIKTSAIADAPYAAYVHNGTSRAGPRPFMSLTVEAQHPQIVREIHEKFLRHIRP